MIRENVALKKNSISIEMILCHDCDQQKCQDIISMRFYFLFHCDLEHKHNQCECDSTASEEYYVSHNRVNFSHTFHHNRNLML